MPKKDLEKLRWQVEIVPLIQAAVLHRKVDASLSSRPLLAFADPDSGKVIAVAVKARQLRERKEESSSSVKFYRPRIQPFDHQQYYLLIGDEEDLDYEEEGVETHLFSSAYHHVFSYKQDYRGASPPGKELAALIGNCLDKRIKENDGQRRPRNIEALLLSNSESQNRFSDEKDPQIKIYHLERTLEANTIVVKGITSASGSPAYFSSSKKVWKGFCRHLDQIRKHRPEKKDDLDNKIAAAIAALASASDKGITAEEVDAVTVPFTPPPGNKSYARYDIEYLQPLYELAVKARRR